jgi:hypothetical protein
MNQKRTSVISIALAGLLFLGQTQGADAALSLKVTNAQKLKMNKKSCALILKRTMVFQDLKISIDSTDYVKQRSVYMTYAKYVDSFYFKTFGQVASTMGSLRDEVWQVADRSADLNKVTKTTMDQTQITDLTYSLDQSLGSIDFLLSEFTAACEAINGVK